MRRREWLWVALSGVVMAFVIVKMLLLHGSSLPPKSEAVLMRPCRSPVSADVCTGVPREMRFRNRINDPASTVPVTSDVERYSIPGRGYEEPAVDVSVAAEQTGLTLQEPNTLCAAWVKALEEKRSGEISQYHDGLLKIGAESVSPVVGLVNSGNPSVEIEAVRLLVQIGGAQACAVALGRVLTLSKDNVRYPDYLAAFSDCRETGVAEWLVNFLRESPSEDVRSRVKTILSSMRGPEVTSSLAAEIGSLDDPAHADECGGIVMLSSHPSQVEELRALLADENSQQKQVVAILALANVGDSASCQILAERSRIPDAMGEKCCAALATVTSAYGQETLLDLATNPGCPAETRCSAVRALGQQQNERVRTVLANLGETTTDCSFRQAICQALESGKESGTPPQSGSAARNAGTTGESWL